MRAGPGSHGVGMRVLVGRVAATLAACDANPPATPAATTAAGTPTSAPSVHRGGGGTLTLF